VTYDGDLTEAIAPLSVTLVLDRELDISRGDLIVSQQHQATVAKSIEAAVVWMDQRPLELHRRYLLKHTSHTVPAFVTSIKHRTDIGTLSREPAEALAMNGIGVINLQLLRPIALNSYAGNRSTGAFILIDAETNATLAAGMIVAASNALSGKDAEIATTWGPVTASERAARWGHRGGVLELGGPPQLIDAIERSLFAVGVVSTRMDAEDDTFLVHPNLVEIATRFQVQSGLLVLVAWSGEGVDVTASIDGQQIALDGSDSADSAAAIATVHQLLHTAGVFIPAERAGL
jgi:hypothetical protein